MVKRIISAMLAILLMLQVLPLHAEEFADWQKDGINYVKEHKIMEGMTSDNFQPNEMVTRAQFAVVLSNFFLLEKEASLSSFSDVKKDSWYEKSLEKVFAYHLLEGYNNKMRPNDPLTREEIFVILNRLLQLSKKDIAETEWNDSTAISPWAKDAITKLDTNGYLEGRGNGLAPKANMTRAELAVMLWRLFPKVIDQPGDVSDASGNVVVRSKGVNFKEGKFPSCIILTPVARETDYKNLKGEAHIVRLYDELVKNSGNNTVIQGGGYSSGGGYTDSGNTVKPIVKPDTENPKEPIKPKDPIEDIIDIDRTGVAKNGDIGTFVLVVFKKPEYSKSYTMLVDGEKLNWSKVDDSGLIMKAEVRKLKNEKLTLKKGSEKPLTYNLLQFYN